MVPAVCRSGTSSRRASNAPRRPGFRLLVLFDLAKARLSNGVGNRKSASQSRGGNPFRLAGGGRRGWGIVPEAFVLLYKVTWLDEWLNAATALEDRVQKAQVNSWAGKVWQVRVRWSCRPRPLAACK